MKTDGEPAQPRPRDLRDRRAATQAALRTICAASLAALAGCAINPNTGRSQLMALPAAQSAHANIGYALTSAAGVTPAVQCAGFDGSGQLADVVDPLCPSTAQSMLFARQVERVGAELELAAREVAPDVLGRLGPFRITVEAGMDAGTASSAGGRIALAGSLASAEPTDDIVAFLIAREIGHVIARHAEENSGARLATSALAAFVPLGGFVIKLAASLLGSQALTASWAEPQSREADEIALALLEQCDRPPAVIFLNLQIGLKHHHLPPGEWRAALERSVARVGAIAGARSKGIHVANTLIQEVPFAGIQSGALP